MRILKSAGLWGMAVMLAAWLVYGDSKTDDTGIIVSLLFLFATGFGFAQPQQPWRWGLFWGMCFPLSYSVLMALGIRQGNPILALQLLVLLVPAFFGAYCGAWLRPLFFTGRPDDPSIPSS